MQSMVSNLVLAIFFFQVEVMDTYLRGGIEINRHVNGFDFSIGSDGPGSSINRGLGFG